MTGIVGILICVKYHAKVDNGKGDYLKFACRKDLWHAASWSEYLSTSDISIFLDSELLWRSAKWRSLSSVFLIFSKKLLISELSCSIWRCVLHSPFTKHTVDVLIRKFKRTSSSIKIEIIRNSYVHSRWIIILTLFTDEIILNTYLELLIPPAHAQVNSYSMYFDRVK